MNQVPAVETPGKTVATPPEAEPAKRQVGQVKTQVGPWQAGFKEILTGSIGVAIAGVTLWMLISTYVASSQVVTVEESALQNREVYEQNEKLRMERKSGQKDILLIAVGLLGSVMGYYFGRVPAEHRAAAAEAAATGAQTTAADAVSEAAAARSQAESEKGRTAEAEKKVEDAKRTASSILNKLQPTMEQQRKTLSAGVSAQPASPDVLDVHSKLEDLLTRL